LHRLTCIYGACKIEENHVSAEELGKGISQDHQLILNNEMIVYQAWMCRAYYYCSLFFCFVFSLSPYIPLLCKSLELYLTPLFLQSLEFDLIVYAPYRSIDAFVNDLEVSMINPLLMKIFCFRFVQESSFVCDSVCVLIFFGTIP